MRSLSQVAFAAACAGALLGRSALAAPVVMPEAEQFELAAKSGAVYRIYVAAPSSPAPEAGWPIVYLTDANSNFPVVVAAARRQTPGNNLSAVVVGIGYPSDESKTLSSRRTLDLTPPASEEFLKKLPGGGPPPSGTGGNDAFLSFIEDELKPHVESRWKIDRGRQSLFGHSFGGLFALHVMFTKPECFQTYLASSPSIWWNDRSILSEEKKFLADRSRNSVKAPSGSAPTTPGNTPRLLLTAGEWEEVAGPGETPERAKMLAERRQVTEGRELTDRLKAGGIAGLVVEFREFPEETHGSVLLPAAGRAVRFAPENGH